MTQETFRLVGKDRKHFIESWISAIKGLYPLGYSLPQDKVKELRDIIDRLKGLAKEAGEHTYPETNAQVFDKKERNYV